MTKKTKYLGNESGKSSKKWFTPSSKPHPHTGDGMNSRALKPGSAIGKAIKVIFRSPDGKKIK